LFLFSIRELVCRLTDRTRGLFCRRSPETTCESVSHTTKNRSPRPPRIPTAPTTRTPSGTTPPPSPRWSRLSVSSAPSSASKPVAEGSGKGVFSNNLCDGPAALRERVRFLVERYAEPVLVETYLPGPEFTVAILGNGPEAYCLPVIGFDFSTLPQGAPPVYGY